MLNGIGTSQHAYWMLIAIPFVQMIINQWSTQQNKSNKNFHLIQFVWSNITWLNH